MVTLEELKQQARQRADMEESEFVSDAELTAYINASLAELHDLLIASYCDDYVMEEHSFTADGTLLEYALPADFYKLRGVDVRTSSGGSWATVKRFNFNKRNEDQNNFSLNLAGDVFMEYRLVGSNIRFNRVPSANMEFRIYYHPLATKLVDDSDAYDDVNQYGEYVVVDAAIKCLAKEESDTRVLMSQKEALRQRIISMAANRDANEPASVSDVYAENSDAYIYGRS